MAYDGYRSQRCAPLGSTAPWATAGALRASSGESLREECERGKWSSTPCEGLLGEERSAISLPPARLIFWSRR